MRSKTLTTKQKKAIVSLANGDSHAVAAKHAGVARETVSRWHSTDKNFRHAVNEASDKLLDDVIHTMSACLVDATRTLRTITNDTKASNTERTSAAYKLAQIALNVREQHLLSTRLEALDARLMELEQNEHQQK